MLGLVALVAAILVADLADELAGYIAVIWIAFGAAVAIGRGLDRVGWVHLAWYAVTSGGAMLVARPDTVGVLGWVATVGAMLVVATTTDRLVKQTRTLAIAEPRHERTRTGCRSRWLTCPGTRASSSPGCHTSCAPR